MSDVEGGPLPEGWRWARLGEVAGINPRRESLKRADDALTTFIPMSALYEGTGVIARPELRPFGQVIRGYTAFRDGDVLFAKITPCMENGKHTVAFDLSDGIGFGTTEFHVMRTGPNVLAEWVHAYIRQPRVLEAAARAFTGAVGQQRVPPEFLGELAIPLPPLPEQRRIADLLDAVMEEQARARAGAEQTLSEANTLARKGLAEEFVRAADEHGNVPLEDVTTIVGGFGFPLDCQGRTDLPYPFAKVSDMSTANDDYVVSTAANTVDGTLLKRLGARTYPAGTVIFPKVGGAVLTNKKRVLGVEATFDNNVMGLIPEDIESEWLLQWMFTIDLAALANTQSLPSINQARMRTLEIPLPPAYVRRAILARLADMRAHQLALSAAATAQLAAIDALPGAMLAAAFRGEL